MPRTWTELLQNLLSDAVRAEPNGVLLVPHAAIDDAIGWLGDPRPYESHHMQAWASCFDDADATFNALGPRLAHVVAPMSTTALVALTALRNLRRAPEAAARDAAIETLTTLRSALQQQEALSTAWHDLVDAAKEPANLDTLRFRARCLVDLLRRAERSVDSMVRVIEGVLADGALWQLEARTLLGDVAASAEFVWPLPDAAGGLTADQRAALCGRLVAAPPGERHHVVWVAFDHAGVHVHPGVTVAGVQFYDGDLIRSAIAAGSAVTPLPDELFTSRVSEHDIPTGNVVMARVDLGRRTIGDAPSLARQLARTLVEAAVFQASIERGVAWFPLDDYLHFVDGRYAGGSQHARREPIPLGRLAQEAVGAELQSLADTALNDPEWHAARLKSLEALTWFRKAVELDAAPRLMLDVRVLEVVAVRARSDDATWWRYLDDFWKHAWVRHQMFEGIAYALQHCLRTGFVSPPELDPEAFNAASELIAGVVRTLDQLHYEVDVIAGIPLLPQLADLFSPYSIWGCRLRTLAHRSASAAALRHWADALEKDWDRLRQRTQRSRNALTHGGPVQADVIDAAARFAHQLAAFALSEELTAVGGRIDSGAGHGGLADNANSWRAYLTTASDASSALAGERVSTSAASPALASTPGTSP